jgi:hypothetical protein
MNKKILLFSTLAFVIGMLIGYIATASPGPAKPNPGHSWSEIGDFPSDCPSGQYVYGLGTTLKCSTPSGVSGSGTTNYIPRWTGSTSLGNSLIYQSGSEIQIFGNLYVSGTARIRPPLGYVKSTTTYEIPNENEATFIDDPMGAVTITINGPSTLWIVYRGRVFAKDYGSCGNAHSYGYSQINVDGTDYGESMFAWEVSSAEGATGERGFISTLLIDVSCASYPCTKTIKGRIYVHDGNCPCAWPLGCNVRQSLAQRNLFVEAFRG